MHEFVLKIFNFIKNLIQFLQIVLLFFLLLLILYWTENLAGLNIVWMDSFNPILEQFVALGNLFSNGSSIISDKVFEHKYIYSLFLVLSTYLFLMLLIKINDFCLYLYEKSRIYIKKTEEKYINKQLENEQQKEQKKIKKYIIFISTKEKESQFNVVQKVDLDEQNKIMNKYLVKKTGVVPEIYEGGFLYHFSDFDSIDETLKVFFALLSADAPLDYQICVQAYTEKKFDKDSLNLLIALKLYNKITLSSETAYRYNFNHSQRYKLSKEGVFQKDGAVVDVSCFEEDN